MRAGPMGPNDQHRPRGPTPKVLAPTGPSTLIGWFSLREAGIEERRELGKLRPGCTTRRSGPGERRT
jgi:hypothetical protein